MEENYIKAEECIREIKYPHILELKRYCDKIGVESKLMYLYDGYKLMFNNNSDFIQHSGSCGCYCGCVEPCGFNDKVDYTPITLNQAKNIVRINKDRLNKNLIIT